MTNEIKTILANKQENEKKRKNLESQLTEMSLKYQVTLILDLSTLKTKLLLTN